MRGPGLDAVAVLTGGAKRRDTAVEDAGTRLLCRRNGFRSYIRTALYSAGMDFTAKHLRIRSIEAQGSGMMNFLSD